MKPIECLIRQSSVLFYRIPPIRTALRFHSGDFRTALFNEGVDRWLSQPSETCRRGQGPVTAIAILLRHRQAGEIAKTQRPRPSAEAVEA
jgi:hypothetical protein